MDTMHVKTKAGDFHLVGTSKLRRVLEGTTLYSGMTTKGLGEDGDHDAIMVAYDKIAGEIRGKEGAKVKNGCFYDKKTKKAHEKPEVVYVFRIRGKTLEVPAGKEMPFEVKAEQMADEVEKKERVAAAKKSEAKAEERKTKKKKEKSK